MFDGQGPRVVNVLFPCTDNSARSILAESILNRDGEGHFRAFSAGAQPKGAINPFACLPVASLDKAPLRTKLTEIGQSDGASSPRNSAA